MATKKIRIENDAGLLKRQIDVNTNDRISIYDENDTEVMDIEAHAARHEAGGADEINLQAMRAEGDPAYIKLVDTGAGGAERRIASDSGHVKIVDKTGAEVMDIEAHAVRHAQNGADEVVGIVLQGPSANRPPAGIASRFWLSTDTLAFYYDNGTTWQLVGILGGLDLTSHGSRHSYLGPDALPANALRFSQIDKVFGTETSVNVAAGSTQVISKGIYYVRCGANTSVEYSPDGGTTWYTLIAAGGVGLVISDGSKVRFKNTGASSQTSYLLPIV